MPVRGSFSNTVSLLLIQVMEVTTSVIRTRPDGADLSSPLARFGVDYAIGWTG
jgi:hypothetical protein